MGTGLGACKRIELPLTVRAWRVKKREYSVKTILSLFLACLSRRLYAFAQQQPVTQVHTALNHLTVIEVGEPITMAAAGSDAFEIERHANRVFVKPTRAGVSTNLFVWTEHGRSVYELQPAADVSKMDVLIGAAQTPSVSAKAEQLSDEDVSKIADKVLSHTLLNAERINAVGLKTQKNRVNVKPGGGGARQRCYLRPLPGYEPQRSSLSRRRARSLGADDE